MIVVPMAGLSSRFTKAGYDKPKYMLPVAGRTLFDRSVSSFSYAFEDTPFLFIVRDVLDTPRFVAERLAALGVKQSRIVTLRQETAGQAATVAMGLTEADVTTDDPITIFNIDTICLDLPTPTLADETGSAGSLDVFEGSGANWSFVLPDRRQPGRVLETTEKRPVSNLCCTGLYRFAAAGEYLAAFEAAPTDPTLRGPNEELYVAPLYNWIIRKGGNVHYRMVRRETIVFCGVPEEYEALVQDPSPLTSM